MISIKDDIATCLRMLRARGGALDLKAADFIEAMDSVGTRQQTEIQALEKRIAALEGTLAGAGDPAELSTLRTEFRGAMHELDEVRITLAKALKTELHDGDTAFLLAHHVGQLVIALRKELGTPRLVGEKTWRDMLGFTEPAPNLEVHPNSST